MTPMRNRFLRGRVTAIVLVAVATLLSPGCSDMTPPPAAPEPSPDIDSYLANVWFNLTYNRVKADGISPPVASRIYGCFGVALYEAVVGGSTTHRSVANELNGSLSIPAGSGSYHWPTVANRAVAAVLTDLFAGRAASLAAIAETRDSFDAQYAGEPDYAASVVRGDAIGDALIAWTSADGFATRTTSYTECTDPGCWERTPPANAAALEPGWGALRPFVIAGGSAIPPAGAPAFSTDAGSAWDLAARQVYDTTGDLGAGLSAEQLEIALFWADGPTATGTPAGHSMSICRQIIEQKELDLFDAAEAYARVGMAVADAFIQCWYVKFDTELMRPITYIQRYIDANWDPRLTTPNFPTYTSGHSAESGASARAMADLWGDNTQFTDHTHDGIALNPRSFTSFTQAALECAVSRLYGGIHFEFDNEDGFAAGQQIGAEVSALPWRR
jgi:hypothetical protein